MAAVSEGRMNPHAHEFGIPANRILPLNADSCILKLLSAIPLIGIIPQIIFVNSICSDINLSKGNPVILAEARRVAKDFSTAETVGNFLCVAAIVTTVATSLITLMTALWICVGFIALNITTHLLINPWIESTIEKNKLLLEMNRRQAANV